MHLRASHLPSQVGRPLRRHRRHRPTRPLSNPTAAPARWERNAPGTGRCSLRLSVGVQHRMAGTAGLLDPQQNAHTLACGSRRAAVRNLAGCRLSNHTRTPSNPSGPRPAAAGSTRSRTHTSPAALKPPPPRLRLGRAVALRTARPGGLVTNNLRIHLKPTAPHLSRTGPFEKRDDCCQHEWKTHSALGVHEANHFEIKQRVRRMAAPF